MNLCSEIAVAPEITLYHTGPALDQGPLPSFFYFSLSGPDSLCLDPYNQPVQFLRGKRIRVFSLTLPGHENKLPPRDAIRLWAEEMGKGIDLLGNFLKQAQTALEFAIKNQFIDPKRIAVGGLSRGGLIAALLAALDERIRFLLAFAPMTSLHRARDFSMLQEDPFAQKYDLLHYSHQLANRHIRFYIGNNDTLVSTRSCFDLTMDLVEKAKEQNIQSPQIELFISPSIGQKGHGTPAEIFKQGADWIADCL